MWRYPEHGVLIPAGLAGAADVLVPVSWYAPPGAEGTVLRALAALAYGLFMVGAACLTGRVLSRLVSGKAPALAQD